MNSFLPPLFSVCLINLYFFFCFKEWKYLFCLVFPGIFKIYCLLFFFNKMALILENSQLLFLQISLLLIFSAFFQNFSYWYIEHVILSNSSRILCFYFVLFYSFSLSLFLSLYVCVYLFQLRVISLNQSSYSLILFLSVSSLLLSSLETFFSSDSKRQ